MPNQDKNKTIYKRFDRKYATIMGIKIDSTPKSNLLNHVRTDLSKKLQFYIVTPNPEIINQAQSVPELKEALNNADIAIPDGFGLKLVKPSLNIIKGREFMLDLLKIANEENLKVFILGSRPDVNKRSVEKIIKEYPNLKVKGNSGPELDIKGNPVTEVNVNLQFDIVKEINSFKPDLLLVAFGAPKQEIWISRNLSKLNVTGAMAIGGSLDYYGGFVRKVPKFMEILGLEWLWRLIQEPDRFGRIINAVIIFPIKVIMKAILSDL